MFTVKVRDSDALGANERLYSAETIRVVHPSSPSEPNWDKAGIYLDPAAFEEVEGQSYARDIILFGGDHTEDAQKRKGGKVWVMNDQGATVAQYDL